MEILVLKISKNLNCLKSLIFEFRRFNIKKPTFYLLELYVFKLKFSRLNNRKPLKNGKNLAFSSSKYNLMNFEFSKEFQPFIKYIAEFELKRIHKKI